MDISDIQMIVKNVAQTEEGFKFIEILLDKFGAFERGYNFQNNEIEAFNKGRREQGLWLLDLLRDSHFNRFIEINKKRRDLCQQQQKKQQQNKQQQDKMD